MDLTYFCFLSSSSSSPLWIGIMLLLLLLFHRPIATPQFAVVALHAEPTTMDDWKEQDFEADLAKVQKEAEERLDEKVSELLSNIESVGTN